MRATGRHLAAVPSGDDAEFEDSIAVIRNLALPDDVKDGMEALALGMRQQDQQEANGGRRTGT